jgi:hypothetical protein
MLSTEMDPTDTLLSLVPKVTPRDRQILSDLYDHQVLTTHHLHQLHFAERSVRMVRLRMQQLRTYGLVSSFRPYAHAGTSPNHWVVDQLGLQWLAAQRNTTPTELDSRADHRMRIALHHQLGHVLGLADAFVEYDTGTEPLTKVVRKMKGYTNLATESALASIVLFAVHSDQRAEHLLDKLATAPSAQLRIVGAYVSTHERLNKHGPERAVWRAPGGHGGYGQRLSLVDIALRHPRKEQGRDDSE